MLKKLSCFEFCYFICSIFRHSVLVVFLGVVLLLNQCSPVRQFRGIPTVRPVFRCSTSVLVFRQCSMSRSSFLWCCFVGVPLFNQCSRVALMFRSFLFRSSWFCTMFCNIYLRSEVQFKLVNIIIIIVAFVVIIVIIIVIVSLFESD